MSKNLNDNTSDAEKAQKIQSLREMIGSAEKTIQSAKAMLLQFEGKKKAGRKRKIDESEEGEIVQGTFDGQIMIGSNGKHYPVPANYASKSKLVEGDLLKLTITSDGSFIYKQIGPVERRNALGIVAQDEGGNYYIIADGKPYKMLLASVTYFKAEPGDEVAIVIPRDIDSHWASIENVVQKARHSIEDSALQLQTSQSSVVEQRTKKAPVDVISEISEELSGDDVDSTDTTALDNASSESDSTNDTGDGSDTVPDPNDTLSLLEEWQSDIEEIEKEIEATAEKEKETSDTKEKVNS